MTLHNPLPLPASGKISAPGVYAVPIDAYHGDLCVGPSISSSGLRTIWSESPAHYWARSPLNPKRLPAEDKPQFALGRLAHKLLLEGEGGFGDDFVIRPDEFPDYRTKDARAWRDAQILAGKTIVTDEDMEIVRGMAAALERHPLIAAGILDGHVERSLVWKDRETGIWIKARPDVIPNASGIVADLKTTTSVTDDSLSKSIASFGYQMQAAVVGMALKEVLDLDMESFSLVWVEKAPPFCVRVTTLVPADIERGAMQVRSALSQMARCLETGDWPGPGGDRKDGEYLPLPAWAAKRIDSELELQAAEASNDNVHTNEAA